MINIIIFSGCGLIRFSLKKIVNDFIEKGEFLTHSINVVVESRYSNFMDLLCRKNNVLCVFDVDDVSTKNRERASMLVNARFGESSLLVLCKDYGPIFNGHIFDSKPDFVVSKCASMNEISNRLFKLIQAKLVINKEKNNRSVTENVNNNRGLTHRQQQVLKLLMLGMSNYDISNHLEISNKTVSTHKKGIYDKYQVDNIIDLYYKVNAYIVNI